MSKIISIHSFRGGTGKSNTTANLAGLLAAEGRRVGVIDTDIQSPGIHVLSRCPARARRSGARHSAEDSYEAVDGHPNPCLFTDPFRLFVV